MSEAQTEKDSGFDDIPIITYSNRIQKHLFKLTEELSLDNKVSLEEKRKLRLIVANLPPQAKKCLAEIYALCESDKVLDTQTFDKMYGAVHDWIYTNILQDAFKAKPRYRSEGKL